MLIADEAYVHAAAGIGADRMAEIAGVADWLSINANNDISGPEARLFRSAPLLHRAHQHALPALYPEKIAQLRRNVLHHESTAQRRVHNDYRYRHIKIRNGGHVGHIEFEVLGTRAPGGGFVPRRQLHLDGDGLSLSADAQCDQAPGGRLADHPSQLRPDLIIGAVHG